MASQCILCHNFYMAAISVSNTAGFLLYSFFYFHRLFSYLNRFLMKGLEIHTVQFILEFNRFLVPTFDKNSSRIDFDNKKKL